MTAGPTIGDDKCLTNLTRQIKSLPVKFQHCPLTGPLSIVGSPDVTYRNNDDDSS